VLKTGQIIILLAITPCTVCAEFAYKLDDDDTNDSDDNDEGISHLPSFLHDCLHRLGIAQDFQWQLVFMATLWNWAGHYIFVLSFLLSSFMFFPHLVSAIEYWMSTILPHMMWP